MKRSLLTALALAVPVSALASDSTVKIIITGGGIASLVESEVGQQLAAKGSTLSWGSGPRVTMSRSDTDDTATHASLNLQSSGVPIDLDFDLDFDCDMDGIHVTMDNVQVSPNLPQTNSKLPKLKSDTNAMLSKQTASINKGIWKKLSFLDQAPGGFTRVCPRFSIRSDGGVNAVADFENGCVSHTIRTTASCQPHFIGHGPQQICVNGQWQFYSGNTCHLDTDPPDPPAPPGKNQL